MPDTRLILHVKGTESETKELPKAVVRAAISEGKLSHSQLIWSSKENTWKPARDLPDLVPGERLILHVKGTQSETKELPKAEVRAALSAGKLSHSQLIWSEKEKTWKQAKELPDLVPEERLILHVKGTESETKELPKPEVRKAISEGKLNLTQLIWSPAENTWKQAKELPDLVPGERLILHVKGTESETRELPKLEVRKAISEGKLNLTQLIWVPEEKTWKEAKELPDLVPGERLILHVKGTESETKELPKLEVRKAISEGKLNLTQLIWSPAENSWKQAQELPDLVPGERLILHVKGTESETKELPKLEVRKAISEGQLNLTQLIWSPKEHSWKQAKELPDLMPGDCLILHVKGTSSDTRELPKQAVRNAISQGKLTHSQLIWSEKEQTWKQVREMPDLLPSRKVAPTQTPSRSAAIGAAKVNGGIIHESPNGPVARAVATAAPDSAYARVTAGKLAAKKDDKAKVPKATGYVVKEEAGFNPLKWLCIGMSALLLLVVGGNYLMVDRPLASSLGQTPYSDMSFFAHFGAFMQPSVLVIHIPPSAKLTSDTLPDFLVALAHGTPQSPLTHDTYERVALTSGWTAQYSFSGYSWKQLGDMSQDSAAERKDFLLTQMGDAAGQSLMPPSTLSDADQQAVRNQTWTAFVAHFTAQP